MGDKKTAIKLFESKEIRKAWDSEKEEWYFSIVDAVGILTDSPDYTTGRKYWNRNFKLKVVNCPKKSDS